MNHIPATKPQGVHADGRLLPPELLGVLQGDGQTQPTANESDERVAKHGVVHAKASPPLLSIADVGITYSDSRSGDVVEAVRRVSFDIRSGEFVTIVGLSGCGKSTLLSAVAGLIAPSRGSITLSGQAVKGPGPERAVAFQKPSLLPWRTVIDNVTYGLELRGVGKETARARAIDCIKLVQLEGFEKTYPRALSGGMQQRVNLARALACDPSLLLLDEPFGALDAITREVMQEELLTIWEATQKTVLMVTHQIDEAVLLSDRVLVFSQRPARIVEEVIIDLPRPRSAELRESQKFVALEARISRLIRQTVRAETRHA